MKSLFLASPSSHPEIHEDLYMNGVVSSVPWRGHQEYRLVWDTSVLPIMLEKSAICHAVVKTDQHRINLLKMARFTFDKVYPDGTKGVVNVVLLPRVRNRSQTRRVARPTTTHTTRTSNAVEAGAIRHRQSIANMRMAPINSQFASNDHSNQLAMPDDDDDNSLGVEVDGQLQEDEDPTEVDFLDRTEDDILHGYLPDASYNLASMERMAPILKNSIGRIQMSSQEHRTQTTHALMVMAHAFEGMLTGSLIHCLVLAVLLVGSVMSW